MILSSNQKLIGAALKLAPEFTNLAGKTYIYCNEQIKKIIRQIMNGDSGG